MTTGEFPCQKSETHALVVVRDARKIPSVGDTPRNLIADVFLTNDGSVCLYPATYPVDCDTRKNITSAQSAVYLLAWTQSFSCSPRHPSPWFVVSTSPMCRIQNTACFRDDHNRRENMTHRVFLSDAHARMRSPTSLQLTETVEWTGHPLSHLTSLAENRPGWITLVDSLVAPTVGQTAMGPVTQSKGTSLLETLSIKTGLAMPTSHRPSQTVRHRDLCGSHTRFPNKCGSPGIQRATLSIRVVAGDLPGFRVVTKGHKTESSPGFSSR
ncbi:hypothetical protein Bbelb_221660 [Branchiostoma belcheri]|nr:hypothetical protein Bbelb_221660 [Branchiostoma belcheri]